MSSRRRSRVTHLFVGAVQLNRVVEVTKSILLVTTANVELSEIKEYLGRNGSKVFSVNARDALTFEDASQKFG